MEKKVTKLIGKDIQKGYKISDKQDRYTALDAAKAKAKEKFLDDNSEASDAQVLGEVFRHEQASIVRGSILKTSKRIDGRDLATVRRGDAVAAKRTACRCFGSL